MKVYLGIVFPWELRRARPFAWKSAKHGTLNSFRLFPRIAVRIMLEPFCQNGFKIVSKY